MENSTSAAEIVPAGDSQEQIRDIGNELEAARRELREAEAELAAEQAAVNSFRLHCRLKLDAWIEALSELQTKKQSLYTRLQLMRQAKDLGLDFDDAESFWQAEEEFFEAIEESMASDRVGEDELLLPTDTPRDKASEKRLYRQLVRKFHPDLGTTAVEIAYRTEMMSAVNIAHEQNDVQSLYDLAGELNPSEVAGIAAIHDQEIRHLRQQLLQTRRRRRRAERRLESLRDENTTRLWQKAMLLDESRTDWWEVVRREIEVYTGRVQEDVDRLQEAIAKVEDPP
ncbi:MAG TPA: J domain-containing protein [candidate division Zixibacteria bacterium]|nr:J domain-containing protein [candidate division Zixibacteria bacterium]